MTLAKRLNDMEARLRDMEQWRASIDEALQDEEEEQPILTLDGEYTPGDRDQDAPL